MRLEKFKSLNTLKSDEAMEWWKLWESESLKTLETNWTIPKIKDAYSFLKKLLHMFIQTGTRMFTTKEPPKILINKFK
jgi:ABC-type bacteriocin/lantibiotic exporter with double-glycine peptidase domain